MNNIRIIIITQETLPEPASPAVYQLGLTPFTSPEAALAAAESTCLSANKLTAPFSGIETRDCVFKSEDDSYRTIIFSISAS